MISLDWLIKCLREKKEQIDNGRPDYWGTFKQLIKPFVTKDRIDKTIKFMMSVSLDMENGEALEYDGKEYKKEEIIELSILFIKWTKLNLDNSDGRFDALFCVEKILETDRTTVEVVQQDNPDNIDAEDLDSEFFEDAMGPSEYDKNEDDSFFDAMGPSEHYKNEDEVNKEPSADTTEQDSFWLRLAQLTSKLWNIIVNSFMKMFGTRQTTENTEQQQAKNEPTDHSTSEQSNLGIRCNSKITAFSKTKKEQIPTETDVQEYSIVPFSIKS